MARGLGAESSALLLHRLEGRHLHLLHALRAVLQVAGCVRSEATLCSPTCWQAPAILIASLDQRRCCIRASWNQNRAGYLQHTFELKQTGASESAFSAGQFQRVQVLQRVDYLQDADSAWWPLVMCTAQRGATVYAPGARTWLKVEKMMPMKPASSCW